MTQWPFVPIHLWSTITCFLFHGMRKPNVLLQSGSTLSERPSVMRWHALQECAWHPLAEIQNTFKPYNGYPLVYVFPNQVTFWSISSSGSGTYEGSVIYIYLLFKVWNFFVTSSTSISSSKSETSSSLGMSVNEASSLRRVHCFPWLFMGIVVWILVKSLENVVNKWKEVY